MKSKYAYIVSKLGPISFRGYSKLGIDDYFHSTWYVTESTDGHDICEGCSPEAALNATYDWVKEHYE